MSLACVLLKCGTCEQCCSGQKCKNVPGKLPHIHVQTIERKWPGNAASVPCPMIERNYIAHSSRYLPRGWFYFFEEVEKNPEYDGLAIIRAGVLGDRSLYILFRSFEDAKQKNSTEFEGHNDAIEFYRSVGLTKKIAEESSAEASAESPAPQKAADKPWKWIDVHKNRCRTCKNCKREDCGKCHTCLRSVGCLRRMCYEISRQNKKQTSKYLPEEYYFYFSKMPKTLSNLDGLVILSPSGRKFLSVESAMKESPDDFASFPDAFKLYDYLGIELDSENQQNIETPKRPRQALEYSSEQPEKRHRANAPSHPEVICIDTSDDDLFADDDLFGTSNDDLSANEVSSVSVRIEREHKTQPSGRLHGPQKKAGDTKKSASDDNMAKGCGNEEYESIEAKNAYLKVGMPVYAPFPHPADPLYWGIISKIEPSKPTKANGYSDFLYWVDFDDGDKHKQPIGAHGIQTMEEAVRLAITSDLIVIPDDNRPPVEYLGMWNESKYGPPGDFKKMFKGHSKALARSGSGGVATASGGGGGSTSKSFSSEAERITGPGLSLHELFLKKCGKCEQCTSREECKNCIGCLNTQDNSTDSRMPTHICVQKMCSMIERNNKVQSSRYLPEDWVFFFDAKGSNPKYEGLAIARRSFRGLRWPSFESAQRTFPTEFEGSTDVAGFYRSVGLAKIAEQIVAPNVPAAFSAKASTRNPAPHEAAGRPWKWEDVYKSRCGRCTNCKRKDCGKCHTCQRSNGCLRRMCDQIPPENKRQTSKYLPEGFSFYFSSKPKTSSMPSKQKALSKLDGLVILAPSRRLFCFSVESAMMKSPKAFDSSIDSYKLYDYLGIELDAEDQQILGRPKRPTQGSEDSSDPPPNRYPVLDTSTVNNQVHPVSPASINSIVGPAAIRRNRCNRCVMCSREECGKCSSCVTNKGRTTRNPLACLRKLCLAFAHSERMQLASGFPMGWKFLFLPPADNDHSLEHEDLRGLRIYCPLNVDYTSIGKALARAGVPPEELPGKKEQFCKQIGASSMRVTKPRHELLGASFKRQWRRLDGTVVAISGSITKVEKDLINDSEVFTVKHDPQSLCWINGSSSGRLQVPSNMTYEVDDAWDGCLNAQREIMGGCPLIESAKAPYERLKTRAPYHYSWKNPAAVFRMMVPAEEPIVPGFQKLPCALVFYKGYKLTFTVKKSAMAGARFGTFLSILPEFNDDRIPDTFSMGPGELLDFGVYAPFRREDWRGDHEHIIKCLILSSKNEAYCFQSRDGESYLDITDNETGELHMEARRHVPPFVNEISHQGEIAQVHARYDPEGALHYLLGHRGKSDGPFAFPANGTEKEIRIDYGAEYEKVRLREGYPRKPLDDAAATAVLEKEQLEYISELDTFTANEVDHFVKTYRPLLTGGAPPPKSVLLRLIAVTVLLHRRAESMHQEFLDINEDESICDNGATAVDLFGLKSSCEQMIHHGLQAWCNVHGSLANLLRDAKSSDLFRNMFATVFSQFSIDSISAEEFRKSICLERDPPL